MGTLTYSNIGTPIEYYIDLKTEDGESAWLYKWIEATADDCAYVVDYSMTSNPTPNNEVRFGS